MTHVDVGIVAVEARCMGRTRAEQRAEVAAWRASGQSMAKFAHGRGYSRSSLEKWKRAVRDDAAIAPEFLRVEVEAARAGVVVEVGAARICVARGFDAALLRAVVDALGGRGS